MGLLNQLSLIAPIDMSGTLSNSGDVAAIAVSAGVTRFDFFNPSAADLWLRWGGVPAVGGAGSFKVSSGGSYRPPDGAYGTLRVLSTVASQNFTAYGHG